MRPYAVSDFLDAFASLYGPYSLLGLALCALVVVVRRRTKADA